MTLVLVYAKRTIRIVFKKVGVYSGTAFVHDYSRKKNTFKSVYKRCDLHHLLPTLTTDILHSGSSATHFECQLLFRVVFVCAMNNGGSKRRVSCIFVHCLSLLPNKFIFFYLLKIIFKLQLMAISRH